MEAAPAFRVVSGPNFQAAGRWDRRRRCMLTHGKLKPHDTIYKFDPKGNVVKSFGAGMFIWPHGLHVDREGNVWATDAASSQAVTPAAKGGVRGGHTGFQFKP